MKRRETTIGYLEFDSDMDVETVPDPRPPSSQDWKMEGSAIGVLDRDKRQVILWFWVLDAKVKE